MRLFIIGISGFIGSELYRYLLTNTDFDVIGLLHQDLEDLTHARGDDVVINCCGINRGSSASIFMDGNVEFLKVVHRRIIQANPPFFIHLSSQLVYGFKGQDLDTLPPGLQYFINSKREGERFLSDNYPQEKLAIIRPCNIIGYGCRPYRNSVIMSLIYDLISNAYQVREINANSHRNFLEIIDLIRELKQIIVARKKGVWEITTARKTSLADALLHIHNEQVPDQIKLVEGEQNVLAESSDLCIPAQIIKVDSDFKSVIDNIITDVNGFRVLEKLHSVRRQVLISDKGKMTEISSLESGRLYKISIAPGKVRGNHYHYVQTEDFYVNRGTVVFFLAHRDNPKIAKQLILQENDFIQIPPYYIHTLVSPHKEMEAEVIITSTQPYIPNATPDTKTVTII